MGQGGGATRGTGSLTVCPMRRERFFTMHYCSKKKAALPALCCSLDGDGDGEGSSGRRGYVWQSQAASHAAHSGHIQRSRCSWCAVPAGEKHLGWMESCWNDHYRLGWSQQLNRARLDKLTRSRSVSHHVLYGGIFYFFEYFYVLS